MTCWEVILKSFCSSSCISSTPSRFIWKNKWKILRQIPGSTVRKCSDRLVDFGGGSRTSDAGAEYCFLGVAGAFRGWKLAMPTFRSWLLNSHFLIGESCTPEFPPFFFTFLIPQSFFLAQTNNEIWAISVCNIQVWNVLPCVIIPDRSTVFNGGTHEG